MRFLKLSGLCLSAPLFGIVLQACSGEASKSASATGGAAGSSLDRAGAAGRGGSVEQAGTPGMSERNPDLRPAPDDTCERFHFVEASCSADSQCPPWPCDPATRPSAFGDGFVWCAPQGSGHCLVGFDCAVAGALAETDALLICIAFYQPCKADADCSADNPYCVIDSRYPSGNCEAGRVGARCRADDDCKPGSLCVAI